MKELLKQISACDICKDHLPLGPRPIVSASEKSRIAVIGQAPGSKVHKTGIPWDDPSGKQLRAWMRVSEEVFYDPDKIALIPMGFCYPGKGKSGDLPPRPECAPKWHDLLLSKMPNLEFTLLIGSYAQKYYLGSSAEKTLTETVRNFESYMPKYLPIPHPSPRNRFWMSKNPWFASEVIPIIQQRLVEILG